MGNPQTQQTSYVRWLNELTNDDVALVGGKNASLGEMLSQLGGEGVRVPGGFATTATAYREFLEHNELDAVISKRLEKFQIGDLELAETGEAIRGKIRSGSFPETIAEAIRGLYEELGEQAGQKNVEVAVRSSATAEDLPDASFAGQQETYLNVRGEDELLNACRNCFASLFTDRAISYREEQGFEHMKVALSVSVQRMVRAGEAGAGVMFTLDTQTGFPDVVVINAAWGLGESVVQGSVNPDEYKVFKPLLGKNGLRPVIAVERGSKRHKIVYDTGGDEGGVREVETSEDERSRLVLDEDEILQLARWAVAIEKHYGKPMDIEWAKDSGSRELFIVQARPETVQSQRSSGQLTSYSIDAADEPLVKGLAIGSAVADGRAVALEDMEQADSFEDGGVLVADMTDPDWVPVMRRASAIVTQKGGRTSHAAIVSRELGVPAVIGAENALEKLADEEHVTVSCAEGSTGRVYSGKQDYSKHEIDSDEIPETKTDVMLIMATPAGAFSWWELPADGIGLARMEFIINNIIKVHPLALARFDEVDSEEDRQRISGLTRGYDDKREYFIGHLARGIAQIAASQYPSPVVVRLSDFKTNEYAGLVGGRQFEQAEENPMLGFRGAARYYSDAYRDGFAMECAALKRAREEIGLDNIIVMVPFCRTPEEADKVLDAMDGHGLGRGTNGLKVYVMAEVPSNVILASQFAEKFDGFSIGSNDLTQLTLGVGRDASKLAYLFDDRHEAVRRLVSQLIEEAHSAGVEVGFCGQAPSDHPEYAQFLVECGIDSISVSPDSLVKLRKAVSKAENGQEQG